MFNRPCVDCGQVTGCFCDYCNARDRMPNEVWSAGQGTPLCTTCDRKHDRCHFCRGLKWCTPPAWRRQTEASDRANVDPPPWLDGQTRPLLVSNGATDKAVASPRQTVVDMQEATASLKPRGKYVVYTEESYKRTHHGRTYKDDKHTLQTLETRVGPMQRVVVWEGDPDIWDLSEKEK